MSRGPLRPFSRLYGSRTASLAGRHEIGWTLAEAFWGRGYATEAARAVLDFAFEELGLARIYSQTSDSNHPSTRMMQRLGFTHLPQLGYVDPLYPPRDNPTTVWRLTAEEWKSLCLRFATKPIA